MFKTISMINLGYIGLPTAALFTSRKVKVIGVDVSIHAVATINRAEAQIDLIKDLLLRERGL